ncbi:hypothetical protein [Laspinema palackyanum]
MVENPRIRFTANFPPHKTSQEIPKPSGTVETGQSQDRDKVAGNRQYLI